MPIVRSISLRKKALPGRITEPAKLKHENEKHEHEKLRILVASKSSKGELTRQSNHVGDITTKRGC